MYEMLGKSFGDYDKGQDVIKDFIIHLFFFFGTELLFLTGKSTQLLLVQLFKNTYLEGLFYKNRD